MPYDKAEVNFQSGPKTDPDANEDRDVQGEGPVPFGGSDARHWIVLIRCEDILNRILLKQLERGAHNLSKPIASMLGGGKAPRLSEVHCDRDSVCVKTDTEDLR